MEKQRVAFIGLGVMGYPMAGYLSKAGYETKVYNRTKAKADKWAAEYNGIACETPREAAEGCDIVFTCVGNDNDVRSVVYGEEGLLVGLKAGAVWLITQQPRQNLLWNWRMRVKKWAITLSMRQSRVVKRAQKMAC